MLNFVEKDFELHIINDADELGVIDGNGKLEKNNIDPDDLAEKVISQRDVPMSDNLIRFFLSEDLAGGTWLADRLSESGIKAEVWSCPLCEESMNVQYRLPFAQGSMLFNGNNGDGWQIIPYEALPEGPCNECNED